MKNYIIITCLLLLASFINAGNLLNSNKFSRKGAWIFYRSSSVSKAGGSVVFINGKAIIKSPRTNKQHWSGIQLLKNVDLSAEKSYRLSFKAITNKKGKLNINYSLRKAPYTSYAKSLSIELKPEQKKYAYTFKTRKGKDGVYGHPRVIRIAFGAFKDAEISIYDISLEEVLPLAINKSWSLFLCVIPPKSFANIPQKLNKLDGKTVIPQIIKLKNQKVDFAGLCKGKFILKDCSILYNEFVCKQAGIMRIGVSADWWMKIYVNGKMAYSTIKSGNAVSSYSPDDHVFDFPVKAGKNIMAVEVLAGSKGWKFVCGSTSREPVHPKPNIKFSANSKWKTVDMSRVRVKAGSVLDLSRTSAVLLTNAGSLPRLVIGATGKLEAQNNPGKAVRLNGYSIGSSWYLLNKSDQKEELNNIVKLARIQGYNLFRGSVELICPKKDLLFAKQPLDKADYLLSRMKQNGIYMYLNLYAYHLYHNRKTWGPMWKLRNDNKIRMYLSDPVLRKEFKEVIGKLMNHINPYTKLAWKDDPVFACMELYNEQNLGLLNMHKANIRPETLREFNKQFRVWLENKYKTPANLSDAWNDKAISSFKGIRTPRRLLVSRNKLKGQDFVLFLNKLSRENSKWLKKTLRDSGYKGLIAHYNLPKWMGNIEARFENSQVAICNTYFKHPSNQTKIGSKCSQNSSINSEGAYFCHANATRFADRPFCITETNHSFWNQYQHEGGLMFGAYAALQGFDARVAHATSVILSEKSSTGPYKNACSAFSIGNNPVARANEFLSACLYLRGDVQAALKRVQLDIPKASMNDSKAVSSQQSKIALMTAFSVSFPWAKPAPGVGIPKKPDMIIAPDDDNSDIIKVGNWFTEIVSSKKSKSAFDAFVNKMKAENVLPKSNISVPSKGIYQSDTGEIILRSKENLMKVCTSRSEAVTLEANRSELVGQLKVIKTSVPALVAACSIDGRNLKNSKRIVFIYSTEIANTGMTLSHDRVTMLNLGKRPVLMRVGKLSASLKNNYAKNMSLYALDFDGSRREKLPLDYSDGVLKIKIATEKLKNGPTPFFELSAK